MRGRAGRVHGAGRLSLIEGPAGIGKTRLLEEVRRHAGLSEMTVLSARGGELERNFGFGIVRQLLESTLARTGAGERAELLSGAARLAEPVFGSPTTEQDLPADHAQALLHGLYWLVANLAEASPLLLAVDDVQWADEPSLRFLTYLARRLDGVRAAIAIANRTGEAKQPQVLDSLALEARPPIIRPSPLSEAGVGQVVREAFGHGAGPMLFAACHQATGGNPFLLIELLEELRHTSGHFGEISPPGSAVWGRSGSRVPCYCASAASAHKQPRWCGRWQCWACRPRSQRRQSSPGSISPRPGRRPAP